tara:strand:- start:59 stop:196 length:138 start_codon:yes stop_codon:yes gene_type:complete
MALNPVNKFSRAVDFIPAYPSAIFLAFFIKAESALVLAIYAFFKL